MFGPGIVALATELASADPATCDRAGLATLVDTAQQARGWLDALDVRIALQASRLAEAGSGESAGAVLAGGGRRSSRDAAAAARRGAVCDRLPRVHDALAAGAVSAGHVDAIARLSGELDDTGRAELADLEPTLVASAQTNSVETFEREMRNLGQILSRDDGTSWLTHLKKQRRVRRWVDKQSGMCHTHLELDPETDAKVAAAFDAAVAAARARLQDTDIDFEHLRADALVELITGARSTDQRVPEIAVLIDDHTLRHGLHDHSVCETSDGQLLPPDTIRRLCCGGDIIPIVLGGDGVPLDHGRARRLASHEQRRALRAMYRTCGHPDCSVRFDDCRIHHVTWWEHLGPTDLTNMLPLCETHHHLVHDGHWTLTLKPDRTITLRRPDGRLHFEGDTTNRATTPPAPPTTEPADQPRPHESNIPLHLRRAADPNRRPGPEPSPPIRSSDDETVAEAVRPDTAAQAPGPPPQPSSVSDDDAPPTSSDCAVRLESASPSPATSNPTAIEHPPTVEESRPGRTCPQRPPP